MPDEMSAVTAADRLAAVIALHQPIEHAWGGSPSCGGCLDGCNDPHDCFHEWPCPTYRAATGETEPPDAG